MYVHMHAHMFAHVVVIIMDLLMSSSWLVVIVITIIITGPPMGPPRAAVSCACRWGYSRHALECGCIQTCVHSYVCVMSPMRTFTDKQCVHSVCIVHAYLKMISQYVNVHVYHTDICLYVEACMHVIYKYVCIPGGKRIAAAHRRRGNGWQSNLHLYMGCFTGKPFAMPALCICCASMLS